MGLAAHLAGEERLEVECNRHGEIGDIVPKEYKGQTSGGMTAGLKSPSELMVREEGGAVD